MRKRTCFLGAILAMACSSGDLQIETIDFEAADVRYCGTATIDTELLFKLNESEALILQLPVGLLLNEPSDGTLQSGIPGSSKLTYRIFDGSITNSYFCGTIPPPEPGVIENVEAEAGSVLVTTTQDPDDPTLFEHEIRLSGITFVNSNGERITNLNLEDFGTIVTSSD